MPSLGSRPAWLVAACLASVGCGGSESASEGPVECEPVTVDVDTTCTDFCETVIGECDAFVFNEDRCRAGCEDDLSEAYGCSEDCGTILEAMFQCVAERDDCRDVFGWRDITDDHACTDEVDEARRFCPF